MSARSAQPASAGLGTPGNSFSTFSLAEEFAHLDARERRFELRRKARRFVDTTDVPVYATDENGATVYGADGEPVVTRLVARGDRYLACGQRRRDGAAGVGVKWDGPGSRAGLSNLQSCGSVWACPVCAAKVQAERAEELRRVLAYAEKSGHLLVMVTLTLRHYKRHDLADLWDATAEGWHSVTKGAAWAGESVDAFRERKARWYENYRTAREWGTRYPARGRQFRDLMAAGRYREARALLPRRRVGDAERFGVLGWVRAVEVTDGRHGWHPHVHAVLVLDTGKGREEAELAAIVAGERMHSRWRAGVERAGFQSLRESGGYHLSMGADAQAALLEYIGKDQGTDAAAPWDAAAISREVVMGAWKSGHRKGRTPFQILALIDYDKLPDQAAQLEARWREFVNVSEGRRQLTWSSNLRELAGIEKAERSDEEIAADDQGGAVRLVIDGGDWDRIGDVFATTILDLIEVEGVDGLASWLRRAGIGFELAAEQPQDGWYDGPPDDDGGKLW